MNFAEFLQNPSVIALVFSTHPLFLVLVQFRSIFPDSLNIYFYNIHLGNVYITPFSSTSSLDLVLEAVLFQLTFLENLGFLAIHYLCILLLIIALSLPSYYL